MEISPVALAKIIIPRIPLILSTAVLNRLSLSANSDKQDARTEIIISIIRSMFQVDKPLNVIQNDSLKGPLKGKMWIAKTSILAPDAQVRDAVVRAIQELGNGSENYILPDVCDVEGEWTGYRETTEKAPRPDIPEGEHYEHLMKETTSDLVILYFHGGAYFMMDPATHRGTVSSLAKKTGGRGFSVRYRLAPQHPFPAALLDALTAYLYLLSPPPGSFHTAIPASKIVFAGDSAGGNLATVLTLLLLTLQNAGIKTIPFHGQQIPVQLPAALALNSPWCDITRSLPSNTHNAKYDYLDPPSLTGPRLPTNPPPPDSIWPSNPPRAEIYCQASILMHPLVSPVLATPEMWKGVPPTFIAGGTEGLEDEMTVLARNIYLSGASVTYKMYEGMPHCFAMIFPGTPAARDFSGSWAKFMVDAVEGAVERREKGMWMKAFSNLEKVEEVKLGEMGVADEDVRKSVQRVTDMAVKREEEDLGEWEVGAKARL